jgi:hypothetical protein
MPSEWLYSILSKFVSQEFTQMGIMLSLVRLPQCFHVDLLTLRQSGMA